MRFSLVFIALACMLGVSTAQAQSTEVLREAQRLVGAGDYDEAVTHLEAVGLTALAPEGAYILGRAYQQLLQHDKAVAAFERADTSQINVLAAWGQSLERVGMDESAEARYRAAYRKDSTNQNVAASLARLLSDRNKWGEVTAIYRKMVEEDPENSYLRAQLGSAYVKVDSTDAAIVQYERAHAVNPRNVNVVLALTKVYYDQEFYLSARRVIDRALDQQPRSHELWRRSGEVALREEDYAHAEEAFSNAVRYGDSTAIDLRNLGVSRYFRGRYAEADSALTPSFELQAEDVMTALYLGLTKQQLEQYDEALRYLNHAADVAGRVFLSDIYSRIAGVHDVTEQDGEAIRMYRLAQSLDPNRVEYQFHLAALYDAYYADKKSVLEAYERFLAAVEEGQLPQMEGYAKQRVLELRERDFFDQAPVPSASDTSEIVITPDTSGTGGR